DHYLAERALTLFSPVIDHLREVGEARSCSEIEDHFRRNFDVSGVTTACEYLADQGLIGKASLPVQLTRRSTIEVQELAFYYAEGQRRYMESLSSFAKRFVAQVAKPDVDFVFGLSPVISIEQKTITSNPRSTVGTMTDISNYLNLLFATIGRPHCPRSGEPTP